MRQRYFALSIDKDQITVSEEDAHHILHVMRKKVGDELFFSYMDKSYVGRIDSVSPLKISLMYQEEENRESPVDITLYQCSLKKDNNEFIIQKAVELGVSSFYFVNSSRVINKWSKEDFNRKEVRYQKIIKEASEQSQRSSLMRLNTPISINDIVSLDSSDLKLLFYEKEEGKTSKLIDLLSNLDNIKSISILVGPEGGFTSEEVDTLLEAGFESVSLGRRILRSETATIAALSTLNLFIEK
ncbi:MAG: 16S rRNA (uracil(1498)-N(3))-methyltransferase [Coprobacillus sp.]|nr:16S rRNA (uracil(1498)-N(3))-methyltransferase [Coprobacillus sp.]